MYIIRHKRDILVTLNENIHDNKFFYSKYTYISIYPSPITKVESVDLSKSFKVK
jgi:hypothetical protein